MSLHKQRQATVAAWDEVTGAHVDALGQVDSGWGMQDAAAHVQAPAPCKPHDNHMRLQHSLASSASWPQAQQMLALHLVLHREGGADHMRPVDGMRPPLL
mmetsp:Transcript_9335/g.19937  ORF Transcript_9335/g.19937 Transcript_9335/m.19937 type:complete len:100 (-) Transcript_9335:945-1244(-)|eukprot:CAMPEP_0202905904 /NCGR_PEP_ID=MMETSP1392-20130828/36554_1 /ASSEMBLY_ACC=CAM_ASM_000868 /TAXON_ID=225041 /ORGANISM="Chlamydomonas chlamydogama, Strain SAG 11-48b" /LENGTH=99 /DNA_ID=CAMNT_0049594207 /DNA_START=1572 /DNA_END=1871 /DNA_ORIENTATION=-